MQQTDYRQCPPAERPADNENTYVIPPRGEVRISVRSLVEFLLRSGDIDNRRQRLLQNAMQEGSRIHRMIQRKMGPEYRAEVNLRYRQETERYCLLIEGRADGIMESEGKIGVDEIKGTYRELVRMRGPEPLHLAQAKCYACMYGLEKRAEGHPVEEMHVRITYCNLETEEIRYFHEDFSFEKLETWFLGLVENYKKWADNDWEWRRIRQASIIDLQFPFVYRRGQKELAAHVYRSIFHEKKLFLEAPTGVGKTISTVFPAVKALGQNLGEKIFYLTAKTVTRTVAEDTFGILREKGLCFRNITLTAKEKICFMEKAECNPDYCPYAKGHFDRINDAVFDMLKSEVSFTRDRIEEYAKRHVVCPFEMCLDMSLFADGIICDYNYVFDPHVYLKRFFGEESKGQFLFLIDEAHNLLERGREMYSAALELENFLTLKQEIEATLVSEKRKKSRNKGVSGQLTLELTQMTDSDLTVQLPEAAEPEGKEWNLLVGEDARKDDKIRLISGGYGERILRRMEQCVRELLWLGRDCQEYTLVESTEAFTAVILRLWTALGDYLEEQERPGLEVREHLLEFYFGVSHFLEINECVDKHYVKYILREEENLRLKLFCVNPGENLRERMRKGRSSILFSATLLPIQYYKSLLGGDPKDYEVYAESVFRSEKRGVFVAEDVTSKYTRRSREEYYNIARYIEEVVKNRHGNYMVFCPSYAFLREIYELYAEYFADEERQCVIQKESMSEEEREEFLGLFQGEQGDRMLIGFCVLGGIFSEGIDLKRDSLIGALIVGTGLPQVGPEREILKTHFSGNGEDGFDYAYRYPGMNKVLQAAGRVIRTMEDVGIVVLLDERFLQPAYRRLFPREWERFEAVTLDTVAGRVERFWDSWL